MKKIYMLVSGIVLMTTAANAQLTTEKAVYSLQEKVESHGYQRLGSDARAAGDVLASDDFSDATNWNMYTEGGTLPPWQIVLTEPAGFTSYVDAMASTTQANGFAIFNGVQYLIAGTVTPQNALLEFGSSIDCSGATSIILEFEQAYRAFNTDRTIVEVTNNDWADFQAFELNEDAAGNGPTLQEKVLLNITDIAAGEANVKVRFRWLEESGDPAAGSGYGWMVDDFSVREGWDYDQQITASFHRSGLGVFSEAGLEYYMIPLSQLVPINFSGKTQSLAGLTQDNAKLNVSVSGAGSFSGTSAGVSLLPGATDSLACATTFTPTVEGTYNVSYWVDSDNPEDETSNDTIYDSFMVTGSSQLFRYARDNGFSTGSISNVTSNTGNPLLIGNVMDVFNEDLIGAVDVIVTSTATNVGKLIFAQVMILDESGAFIYADQTADHEITAAENGNAIRLTFSNPISVPANSSILVLAGHYGGTDEVEFRMAQGVEEQTVLGFTSGATEPFSLLSPSAIMVRPYMVNFDGIDDETTTSFTVNQNMPNPFDGQTIINYELSELANVSVEIMDATGKIVQTMNYQEQGAGSHTISINAADFAEGIYFYTFKVGEQKVTKRMVIQK